MSEEKSPAYIADVCRALRLLNLREIKKLHSFKVVLLNDLFEKA